MRRANITKQLIKKYSHINKSTMVRLLKIQIMLAVSTLLIITSCSQSGTKTETKKDSVDSVNVVILKKEAVNKQIIFPAELTPLERAEIYAKVGGYINEFKVDIGDHVQKGQVIAVLEAPEVISNFAQANSDVQTARSKYQTSLDSYKRILNASKVNGTIASGELERAKNQMLADSSAQEAAKSKMNATAQLKEYLTIRSPFDGIVTQRNYDQGTLVGAANSKPIVIVENVSFLRIRIPVPEAYTAAVPDTNFISFSVEARPGKIYRAVLSRKAGAINLSNRTETWEFIYENKDAQLKSGMFASATIKFGREELSFLVPSTSVATTLEKKFVIRLTNGEAEWVDVKNGISQDDKLEVFGLLNEGDIILVRANEEIKPTTKLIARNQSK